MGRLPLRQDQQEYILQVALQLGDQEGFQNLSFQKIANKAKLSQSAVMHYYPNKAQLLEAISTLVARHNVDFVSANASVKDSALVTIQKFIHNNLTWAEKHSDMAKVIVLLSALAMDDDLFKQSYNDRLKAVRQKLEGYLYAAIREKSVAISENEVESWAAMIHGFVVSGITGFLASGEAREKKKYLKRAEIFLGLLTGS